MYRLFADPESLVRGAPNSTTFLCLLLVDEGRELGFGLITIDTDKTIPFEINEISLMPSPVNA